MARRINEQYHVLSSKVLQLRENTKVFDAYTEQALVTLERELDTMTPEPLEGFNALGFLGCLLTTQEGGSFGIC
jgi:hypothetical protein